MEIPYTVQPRPDTGLYNAKVGIWLFLASEVMLFGGLFSAYVLLRVGAGPGIWPHGWLDVRSARSTPSSSRSRPSPRCSRGWRARSGNFGKFKFFHACTMLLALTFLA